MLLLLYLSHPSDWAYTGNAEGILALFAYNTLFINSICFLLTAMGLIHVAACYPRLEGDAGRRPDSHVVRRRRMGWLSAGLYFFAFAVNVLQTPLDTKILYYYTVDPVFYTSLQGTFKEDVKLWNVANALKFLVRASLLHAVPSCSHLQACPPLVYRPASSVG